MMRWAGSIQRLISLKDFVGNAHCQSSFLRPEVFPLLGYSTSVGCAQELVSLNNLSDNPGATRTGKRLGRGIGSGKGKTSGRGHKGQKARRGRQVKIGFEGGQTPIKRATPKRGFHNPTGVEYTPLNLYHLKKCIDDGRLPTDDVITMKLLRDTGTISRRVRDGVKLLARGSRGFDKTVHLQVSQASASAKRAVENRGGSVTTVYYNKLGLRALLMPEWFEKKGRVLPQAARPPPKKWDRFDAVGSLPPVAACPKELFKAASPLQK